MKKYFRRQIALPNDHGSWIFLLSPLLIGLTAGESWSFASFFLILAAFSAFLIRQPITTAVKIASKRRPKTDLPAASFWIITYGTILMMALAGLMILGSCRAHSLSNSGNTHICLAFIPGQQALRAPAGWRRDFGERRIGAFCPSSLLGRRGKLCAGRMVALYFNLAAVCGVNRICLPAP